MYNLSETDKQFISNFIINNKASNLPLIDLKAKKTIKKSFSKVFCNEADLIFYGSDGQYYTHALCKIDDKFYILTFYFDDLVNYAHYITGYEE